MAGTPDVEEPKPEDAFHAAAFPYPSRSDSRRLSLGALLLAFRPANLPFVLFVGAVYFLYVWTLMVAVRSESTQKLIEVRLERLEGTQVETQTERQVETQVLDRKLPELLRVPIDIALSPSVTGLFVLVAVSLSIFALIPVASKPSAPRWMTIPWGVAHGLGHLVLAL